MNHAMVSEFASAIRENRTPRVTGIDGLRAVEARLAAYESERTGQTVEVKKNMSISGSLDTGWEIHQPYSTNGVI